MKVEYIASVREKGGAEYECSIRGFEHSMLNKELWGKWCYSETGNHYIVPKINDAHISEKDLYELGLIKIIKITRIEIVRTETLIYG